MARSSSRWSPRSPRVLRAGGEAWILEGVHAQRTVHRQSVHRSRGEYVAHVRALRARAAAGDRASTRTTRTGWRVTSSSRPRAAQPSSRLRGGAALQSEADYLQRYGDGARLDGLASRSLFGLSKLSTRVHRGPDALGIFVFAKGCASENVFGP